MGDEVAAGSWSPTSSSFSINHRELLAVELAIVSFLPLLQGKQVVLFCDNATAISYLKKEGGTRSSTLNSVAQRVLRLCEGQGIHLCPQFIAGRLNVLADALSRRRQVLGAEWTLCQEVVQDLL